MKLKTFDQFRLNENASSQMRNDALGELLADMVDNGEHGLNAAEILLDFINNVMLQEERDMIIEGIKKKD